MKKLRKITSLFLLFCMVCSHTAFAISIGDHSLHIDWESPENQAMLESVKKHSPSSDIIVEPNRGNDKSVTFSTDFEEDEPIVVTLPNDPIQTSLEEVAEQTEMFPMSSNPISEYTSIINAKDAYSVQNEVARTHFSGQSVSEDYIDPLTGSLTVKQTDLVLPGKDGLDLRLERFYNSAQAELYGKSAGFSTTPRTFNTGDDSYEVVELETIIDGESYWYYYPCTDFDAVVLTLDMPENPCYIIAKTRNPNYGCSRPNNYCYYHRRFEFTEKISHCQLFIAVTNQILN